MQFQLFKEMLLNADKITESIVTFTASLICRHAEHLHLCCTQSLTNKLDSYLYQSFTEQLKK